jgi:hypothetical protein
MRSDLSLSRVEAWLLLGMYLNRCGRSRGSEAGSFHFFILDAKQSALADTRFEVRWAAS